MSQSGRVCGAFNVLHSDFSFRSLSLHVRPLTRALRCSLTAPSGPLWLSVRRLFLVPFLPRLVGFFPVFFTTEPGLAQHRVGTLPFPFPRAELVALGDQHRLDLLKVAPSRPPLEPVMDHEFWTEPSGKLVPRAAAPHSEEDSVEHLPPEGIVLGGGLIGPALLDDRFDLHPRLVGDFPVRVERLESRFWAGHSCALSL